MLVLFLFGSVLIGCSAQQESEMDSSGTTESKTAMDESVQQKTEMSLSTTENRISEEAPSDENITDINVATTRKVIYNAVINLRVKSLTSAQNALEEKANKYGGYIVESTSSRYDHEQLSGSMVFRIPQQYFSAFISDTEKEATNVVSRNVSGQDVTEEFVDLEARLRSKKAVEARLLTFMEEAEKTEDLLKISEDLAKVQEEIEQIEGRVKYLENQTSFSTITVTMEETTISVPSIDQNELNTWQKVKKQLAVNINWLLTLASGSVVLVAGNLPFILLIGMIAMLIVLIRKRRKRKLDHHTKK